MGALRARLLSRSVQFGIDAVLCATAFSVAYLVRFEGIPRDLNFKQWIFLLPYVVLARVAANQVTGVYSVIWRYVSMTEIRIFAAASVLPSVLFLLLRLLLPSRGHYGKIPLSIIFLELLLSFLGMLGARIARRVQFEHAQKGGPEVRPREPKAVLLIGAGSAGVIVAREIQGHPQMGLKAAGFVDDDPAKRGAVIHGLPVLGGTADLPRLVHQSRIDQVIITIAGGSGGDIRRIAGICESIPVRTKIIPGIYELVDGTVNVSRIRDVELVDLLGRDPVELDMEAIGRFIKGNHILVTGAGGSIGAEMCRQVCRFDPQSLILVDRFENNLFDIERELRAGLPRVALVPCVADICDAPRMEAIFRERRPRVVIHAAAHKHVPMMELNPAEAIKNNVLGTRRLADLAAANDVAAFVMISTDKAVNPTSVMGATKRVAEIYVQAFSRRSRTRFITVRFGNVLGSAGSVIPIFKEQIANRGPVTVTHPDMKRYFMTIPEAAQLVLQAASMAQGGEIYVLDMGEPVKIVTLAEQLIRFSGLKPHEDIPIVFTGMRPGEKLFEELALTGEDVSKTGHPKIYIGRFRAVGEGAVDDLMRTMEALALQTDPAALREGLMRALARVEEPKAAVRSAGNS